MTHSTEPDFEFHLGVRDYEIDSQGRAHHSNIVSWTEYARAEYLKHKGFSYSKLVDDGLHLVVSRMTYKFKASIRPGDELSIRIWVTRDKATAYFRQEIIERSTGTLCVIADTEVVAIQDGRTTRGDFFANLTPTAKA